MFLQECDLYKKFKDFKLLPFYVQFKNYHLPPVKNVFKTHQFTLRNGETRVIQCLYIPD